MDDRELLELAAKAAGYGTGHYEDGSWLETRYGYTAALYLDCDDFDGYWNPLEHDGDALRLAIKLQLAVNAGRISTSIDGPQDGQDDMVTELHRGDPYAATRRAIVRAAAEIGSTIDAPSTTG